MDNFPANSNKARSPKAGDEPKDIQQVTVNEVVRKKQGIGRKFKDIFIGGDAKSVWEYVAFDILIPAVKDTVVDAFTMGIERAIFGDARGGSRRRSGSSSAVGFTNYSGYSKGRVERDEPRQLSRRARSQFDFDEILLKTRPEAEMVIERLDNLCERYGEVKVNELYELLGIAQEFTGEKYGWTDLRSAGVTRTRQGYLLDLPAPEELEK